MSSVGGFLQSGKAIFINLSAEFVILDYSKSSIYLNAFTSLTGIHSAMSSGQFRRRVMLVKYAGGGKCSLAMHGYAGFLL